jgi:pyridinium-3,5-biscarboxylic acid mononucleotide synthase
MDLDKLCALLKDVKEGSVEIEEALFKLKCLPFEDLGFAKLDYHRSLRGGAPEVVFCQGKTPDQVAHIVERLAKQSQDILATRASAEVFARVRELPLEIEFHEMARIIVVNPNRSRKQVGNIVVASAGTADMPVAEEAAITAEVLGNRVDRLYDVGVAGLHRLLENRERLFRANVVIAVAGMEGALASVIGGLLDKPVIGVPTSVGYGVSLGGISALLTMLNSCASGVSVVNIDNGFGAGFQANLINKLAAGREPAENNEAKAG